MPSGYSGTPLAKKLGLKAGFNIRLVNQPQHYRDLFTDWPKNVRVSANDKSAESYNMVHLFVKSMSELSKQLPRYKELIRRDGMIWVSWPKKVSKVPTDVREDLVRDLALKIGLVDVKVCAVDETWSGLKLVYRLKDR